MNTSIVTPINDEYEYIQYNDQLRIIHSKSDDFYQMQSIIDACHSNKLCADWFRNQSSKEILNEMTTMGNPILEKIYEKRDYLPNGLRGYYVHKLLVNHIAMWASPRYSIYIFKLLDSYFEQQRIQLQNQITEKQNQIDNLTPRAVPNYRENDYVFFVWKEAIPYDNTYVKLHLIRRHKDYFNRVRQHYDNPNENWFFRENLPISMSCNNDIKNIVKENFDNDEAIINGNTIIIEREILADLYEMIETYFNEFQE